MERYEKISKGFNTKMKKINKKKNSCVITRLWPTLEDMKKDLFIDLEKQEITRLSTGNKLKFFLVGSKKRDNQYYAIDFKGYFLRIHRLFFYYHNSYLPKIVDHKDRNKFNNNIENLRNLNDSESARNTKKRKKTTSKHKGVSWNKRQKKWEARLTLNRKLLFLGYFNNEDDAGQVVNDEIRKYKLEEVSVTNDTPQERARRLSLFDELEPITNLK